jgi:hypothetical protein
MTSTFTSAMASPLNAMAVTEPVSVLPLYSSACDELPNTAAPGKAACMAALISSGLNVSQDAKYTSIFTSKPGSLALMPAAASAAVP